MHVDAHALDQQQIEAVVGASFSHWHGAIHHASRESAPSIAVEGDWKPPSMGHRIDAVFYTCVELTCAVHTQSSTCSLSTCRNIRCVIALLEIESSFGSTFVEDRFLFFSWKKGHYAASKLLAT